MTRDEVVAALKARKMDNDRQQAADIAYIRQRRTGKLPLSADGVDVHAMEDALLAAQAADAEHLAKALDAALRAFDASSYRMDMAAGYAAFLQSLTGPTTRGKEGTP